MSRLEVDTIIVGAGIIGASVFHALTTLNKQRVLLVDRSSAASGATGLSLGIVRNDPEVALPINTELCTDLFWRAQGSSAVRRKTRAFRFVQTKDPRCSEAFFHSAPVPLPDLNICWRGLAGAYVDPRAEYFDPHAVTNGLIAAGTQRGGRFLRQVTVYEPVISGRSIAGVHTSKGRIDTKQIILCTGGWSEEISSAWGLDLPVSARRIEMIRVKLRASSATFPIFVDSTTHLYGRGDSDGEVIAGLPTGAKYSTSSPEQQPDRAHRVAIMEALRRRFHDAASAEPIGSIVGFDSFTRDGKPLIFEHPRISGLIVATGFNGGGFKQGPAAAVRVLELLSGHRGEAYAS